MTIADTGACRCSHREGSEDRARVRAICGGVCVVASDTSSRYVEVDLIADAGAIDRRPSSQINRGKAQPLSSKIRRSTPLLHAAQQLTRPSSPIKKSPKLRRAVTLPLLLPIIHPIFFVNKTSTIVYRASILSISFTMQFTSALLSLAAVAVGSTLVAAQTPSAAVPAAKPDMSAIPPCFLNCSVSASKEAGCKDLTDLPCICTKQVSA